ncbi:MAG TPA: polysaccharide biosynthesis/export family protein [Kiritimatiellia bacterium]|nr:polysaccharide biosynthesis/export family protein [Kiritimatiellia bacterium]HMO99217.1 polysaccharide biosynthesis/export family protein [Kiritimatiellia bacterium]HMP96008.1 polysaccharide biosynthesis/export family protein [Kiritimatiellia bacterium]
MFDRMLFALMLMVVAVGLTGCATKPSTGEFLVDDLPTLSLSATRTVSESSLQATQPAVAPAADVAAVSETGVAIYRLQVGDPVLIHLRGIYPRDETVEDVVDEEGNVTIPHIGDIPAVGKSTSQLESEIRSLYIDGGFYRTITVNVVMPQRLFFIRGEVRSPGRFPLAGGLTLMQAIAAAGGYTEFANQRNVKLIRGGTTQTVNVRQIERNPDLDIRLESGDVIVVERSLF